VATTSWHESASRAEFRLRAARGGLIAEALTGAWREVPPTLEQPAGELSGIASLLLKAGAASLAWRRVRLSGSGVSFSALKLQQAYRLHTLQSAVHERELQHLASSLRSAGLDPILGKGWAIARLYPESGLRPYGDFDLYVRPAEYAAVDAALKGPDAPACLLDLHCGSAELDDRGFDDLHRRSQLVAIGDTWVRIFGPEDHLRLLCLHMLRHGAWRPLWLCDVALALEARPADFDWDYFLSGDPNRTDWVACAIGLAHQLLGARVEDSPVVDRAQRLPRWLTPVVLKQWGEGQTPHGLRVPMVNYLREPAGVLGALRLRWPNPVEATVHVGGTFNDWPRLPYQLGACALRAATFAARLPSTWREGLRG
jgi:putative nucleotidyltransferase-like protein